MLRLNTNETIDETKSINPIIITLTEINDIINNYTKLNYASWDKSRFPSFIATRMAGQECTAIKKLRTFVSSQAFDEHTQLDSRQLFYLALVLSPTVHSKDTILTQAVESLINKLGKDRIEAAAMLRNNQSLPTRAFTLFASLCRIPSQYVRYVADLYAFDNTKFRLSSEIFQLSPENIELVIQHPDRCKTLYQQFKSTIESSNKFEWLNVAKVMEFFVFLSQKMQTEHKVWMNQSTNELISAALKHQDHTLEILYGLAWLTNHGINTEENIKMIEERPTDLSLLPQVGFSTVEDIEIDAEFNQSLFKFAVAEGIKKNIHAIRLFDQGQSIEKETKDNTIVNIPNLNR